MQQAQALSCVVPIMNAHARTRAYFTESVSVFVGQLVEVGRQAGSEWDVSAVGRLKAERWFKGEASPEVLVLLPLGFKPGARLLVFARTNTLADRLRQTDGRRWWVERKHGEPPAKDPDVDIPDLTASGACQHSAFELDGGAQPPTARASGASPGGLELRGVNEMLRMLEEGSRQ
ncbi:MAG: hypothetical protein EOP39_14675 [Rubrivivax sp.]|nr:MAG: hypothetical protein EOP39_14675 [Rubrivivax sp.]